MKTNPMGLLIGHKETIDGVTYLVTKDGIERMSGPRKERRAREAELRKAKSV